MAKITTITNPLTGQPAQVDQLDHTAQQIDDGIARALPGGAIDSVLSSKTNPNLLDNWYFGNPINQRGQTSYTGAGYTIDRWKTTGAGMVVLIENDGITVKNTGTETGYFSQVKEPMEVGYYAASLNVLSVSGAVSAILRNHDTWDYQGTLTISGVGVSGSVLTVKDAWKSYRQWFEIRLAAGASVKLKAIKLELGDRQTLAHQDADGNWILNEIPDYGEQLARCQTSQINLVKGSYSPIGIGWAESETSLLVVAPIPVTLRAIPSIIFTGSPLISGVGTTVTKMNCAGFGAGCCYIRMTCTGLTKGNFYNVDSGTLNTMLLLNSNL